MSARSLTQTIPSLSAIAAPDFDAELADAEDIGQWVIDHERRIPAEPGEKLLAWANAVRP